MSRKSNKSNFGNPSPPCIGTETCFKTGTPCFRIDGNTIFVLKSTLGLIRKHLEFKLGMHRINLFGSNIRDTLKSIRTFLQPTKYR